MRTHGTISCYMRGGPDGGRCPCDDCRRAAAEKRQRSRLRARQRRAAADIAKRRSLTLDEASRALKELAR